MHNESTALHQSMKVVDPNQGSRLLSYNWSRSYNTDVEDDTLMSKAT